MDEEEKEADIRYGNHYSANKEAEFIHADLAEQAQAGHVAVLTLKAVNTLHNLWLSPVAVIPQMGRRPCLISDFTLIGINNVSKRSDPMEAMRFGGALQRILKQILTSDPRLGPVYLSKVELTDAYMRLWVRMEDVPSVAFLVPKKKSSNIQLVGSHLSLPMGYVDSAPYF